MATPLDDSSTPAAGDQTAIARQAILDANRNVIAYELYDRSRKFAEHSAASDAEMLFNVLSHAELQPLMGRKLMYINCTHESLSGKHLELIHPVRALLETRFTTASAARR